MNCGTDTSIAAGPPSTDNTTRADAVPVVIITRGGNVDGAGRQLLYLLEHMDRLRFLPLVLLDKDCPLLQEVRALGVEARISPMRPWRSVRGWPFRFLDVRRAAKIARSWRARIVHCSDPWRAPHASAIARSIGVPLVVHVRGPTTPRDLEKNHCLYADAIIGIAERYRAEIVGAGFPEDRTAIIDDAVDTSVYRPGVSSRDQTRGEMGISADELVVGIVGRIEPLKRVAEFIEAAALVPRSTGAVFLLIGAVNKPDYAAELQRRIQALGMTDRVRLVGRRDDMPAVLGALDLMVTMSGGSVMFEAMACGTCVLSVRPDGRHSQHTIDQQTARCVTTDAHSVAAEAIHRILQDHETRKRLAQAGRDCVSERLSPLRMARRTTDIYERLLAAHTPLTSRSRRF